MTADVISDTYVIFSMMIRTKLLLHDLFLNRLCCDGLRMRVVTTLIRLCTKSRLREQTTESQDI